MQAVIMKKSDRYIPRVSHTLHEQLAIAALKADQSLNSLCVQASKKRSLPRSFL